MNLEALDGSTSGATCELRVALDELDAGPSRERYDRACRAADAFVDENLGRRGARRVTTEFVEHGPTLLERFSEWALLVAVAWHEAGHAVASWALGQRPTAATIIPTADGDNVILGSVSGEPAMFRYRHDDPGEAGQAAAVIAMAGDVAEAPFVAPAAPGARARNWFAKHDLTGPPSSRRGTDCDRYLRAAYDLAGNVANMDPWLAYSHRRTVELLQLHARKVETVALALLRHRELDEEALAELLGPMPGGDR